MSPPTPPPNEPIPATVIAEATRGPIRVVVEQRRSSWIVSAMKWAALALLLILLASPYFFCAQDAEITERYHSLSRIAMDKVAIISVEGMIVGDENFVKKQIDSVRDDSRVKAVVVRVDSPGGTVTGSDYIYHHLKKMAAQKQIPLVVSMGGIAASGGYYVAMATGSEPNTIFAEPTTWTGSIGVIIPHYDVTGLLEKIDVRDDSIASNPLKMMGSPTRDFPEPIRAEEQKILQGLVDSSFDSFKEIVLASRPALRDDQNAQQAVFTGRIFTARQALEHHLVDRLGFVEEAIDRAIELAGLDKDSVRVIKYHRNVGLVDQMLFGQQSRRKPLDLTALADLMVPKAYYLCTWTPALGIASPR
jgi:protease IV